MTRGRIAALALASAAVLVPAFAAPAAAQSPMMEERCEDAGRPGGRPLPPALERQCERIEEIQERREERQGGGESDRPARDKPSQGRRRAARRGRRRAARRRAARRRASRRGRRGARGGRGR